MVQGAKYAAGTDHAVIMMGFDEKRAKELSDAAHSRLMPITLVGFGSASAALSLGKSDDVLKAASALAWMSRGPEEESQTRARGVIMPRGRGITSGRGVMQLPSDGELLRSVT